MTDRDIYDIPVIQLERHNRGEKGDEMVNLKDEQNGERIEVIDSNIGDNNIVVNEYRGGEKTPYYFKIIDEKHRVVAHSGNKEADDMPVDVVHALHASGFVTKSVGVLGQPFDDMAAMHWLWLVMNDIGAAYESSTTVREQLHNTIKILHSCSMLFRLRWRLEDDDFETVLDCLDGVVHNIQGETGFNPKRVKQTLETASSDFFDTEPFAMENIESVADDDATNAMEYPMVLRMTTYDTGDEEYASITILTTYGARRNLFRKVPDKDIFHFERSSDPVGSANRLAVRDLEYTTGCRVTNVSGSSPLWEPMEELIAAHNVVDDVENRFQPDTTPTYLIGALWELLSPLAGYVAACDVLGEGHVETDIKRILTEIGVGSVSEIPNRNQRDVLAALLELQDESARTTVTEKLAQLPEPTDIATET